MAEIREVAADFYEVYYTVDLRGVGSCSCKGWAIRGRCRHLDQAREYAASKA